MSDDRDIIAIIRAVVEDQLRDDTCVVDMTVDEDVDHLGDEILRVNVVYDEAAGTPKGIHTVGLIRLIREALSRDLAENRFPMVSLTSAEDMRADAA